MKRFLFLVFAVLLIGCDTANDPIPEAPAETPVEAPVVSTPDDPVAVVTTPTEPEVPTIADPVVTPTVVVEDRPVWVMNSNWEVVRTDTLKAIVRYSRTIDSLDALNEEIAIHNAAFPENPWTLYVDTVPTIEEAPMCEVWIADKVTNKICIHPTSGEPYHQVVERSDVVTRRHIWEMEAANLNGRLYLDYPPPAEIPPPVYDEAYWHAYYSLYVVNANGGIIIEIHIYEEDWEAQGYFSRDQMFEMKLSKFNMIAAYDSIGQPDAPWRVVARQLYTEPE